MVRHLKQWCWVLLLFLAAGCSHSPKEPTKFQKWMENNGKVKVLCTTAMIEDLVAHIGGEYIDPLTLVVGEIDPHSYELVKGDDEKLEFAQILFYNGLGLEHGASLRHRIEMHPQAVAVAEAIAALHPEKILYRNGQVDPHVWMDVSLWAYAIDPIVEALSQQAPEHAQVFCKNGLLLKERLFSAHREMFSALQQVPDGKRFLVTSHDAFNYFTRSYLASARELERMQWQKRFAAPEGLAPEGQISSVDIQAIIDHLLHYHIEIVFSESNVSRDALRKIIEGCRLGGLRVQIADDSLYGDAMGASGSDADTYLKMMQHNVSVLCKAWEH